MAVFGHQPSPAFPRALSTFRVGNGTPSYQSAFPQISLYSYICIYMHIHTHIYRYIYIFIHSFIHCPRRSHAARIAPAVGSSCKKKNQKGRMPANHHSVSGQLPETTMNHNASKPDWEDLELNDSLERRDSLYMYYHGGGIWCRSTINPLLWTSLQDHVLPRTHKQTRFLYIVQVRTPQ